MLIVIDYDETFTRDPLGWQEVCEVLKAHGHSVIGATMRSESEGADLSPIYLEICNFVVFTDRKAKRHFLAEHDIYPDVWIDDTPEFIAHNARK